MLVNLPPGTVFIPAELEEMRKRDPEWDDPYKDLYWSSPLPGKIQITCNHISGKTVKVSYEKLRLYKFLRRVNRELMANSTSRKDACEDFD